MKSTNQKFQFQNEAQATPRPNGSIRQFGKFLSPKWFRILLFHSYALPS